MEFHLVSYWGPLSFYIFTKLMYLRRYVCFHVFVGGGVVRLGLICLELRKGDWQGHSNNERAVWRGEEEEGAGLSDIWSYLTVGLLFGLTLPGVSAHGFLRGGGWGGAKGYTPQNQKQGILRERRRRARAIEEDRRWAGESERSDNTERLSNKKDGGRQEEIEADR